MSVVLRHLALSSPLFGTVAFGFLVARYTPWKTSWTKALTRFVFALPLPALLFRMMSEPSEAGAADARLPLAFFGSCFVVFALARWAGARAFGLDGASQSVFGLGGVFSNNVLLGVPLSRLVLGPEAVSRVAIILVFNAFTLWTLVTISVEWARHGSLSLRGVGRTARSVATNPLILSIVAGHAFGRSGLELPGWSLPVLDGASSLAGPLALLTLGLGVAEFRLREGMAPALGICAFKLLVHPLVTSVACVALGLSEMDRRVAVLLASLSVGANVYLMAARFEVLRPEVGSSLLLSTPLAAVTAPVSLALLGGPP